MADVLLDIQGLCKSFGALKAVQDVSFTVKRGEVFGIAGPNGSGKSTLFNSVTGIPFRADGGRIIFGGVAVQHLAPHELARRGLTRTFQKDAEFGSLTAQENVRLAAVTSPRVGRSETSEAVRSALAQVQFRVTDLARPARELSVFQKKQLMIASALAGRPALLLMDEPASGLTQPEVEELAELIRSVNAGGVTIMLIEHVLPLLLSVSQRLLILNQGQVLAEGRPAEVVRLPAVIEAYLGKRGAA